MPDTQNEGEGESQSESESESESQSHVESPVEVETVETAPAVPDDVLLASVDLARDALLEITPASTVGAPAGHFVEGEHVLSLLFDCTMPGYPGWHWTVTISR
ncbi:MAG TPA: DUF3027 domain-containing protein, partial [Leifsonia sp.]|nr:DUF3027 domain-containing protein [Leifsonia sp.]